MCIDDFAIKKRETYGTIMVDINTHRVIDMINSRDLENVTTWLKTYPNLQIVSRDGSVTYHNAITCAHSNALQISDRFHLFKNLTDYCKDYLKKELKLQVAIPATKSFIESPMEKIESKENKNRKLTLLEKYQKILLLIESGLKKSQICTELNMDIRVYTKLMELTESEATTYFKTIKEERSLSKTLDKAERANEVKTLKSEGHSQHRISKITGLSTQTVAKYLSSDFTPVHGSTGSSKQSILDPYKSYINQRLELGIMSSIIEKDIREMGYDGSSSSVRHYCSNWKKNKNEKICSEISKNFSTVQLEFLERKEIFKLLYYPLDKVKSISQEQYNNLLDTYSKFASIHTVIWNFRELVSKKDESAFYKWIQYARNLSIKEIDSFLNGIERDIDAVKNAIHYDYSNGLAEGSVNKLKVIKRIMYGRCGFETLRIKTLRLEKMRNIN